MKHAVYCTMELTPYAIYIVYMNALSAVPNEFVIIFLRVMIVPWVHVFLMQKIHFTQKRSITSKHHTVKC